MKSLGSKELISDERGRNWIVEGLPDGKYSATLMHPAASPLIFDRKWQAKEHIVRPHGGSAA